MGGVHSMGKRVEHIDIAKGISIILVALFHSVLIKDISEIMRPMSLFRMPLFFFLSGMFFSASSQTHVFLWKKFDALLKPYFVTLFALLAISAISNEPNLAWKLKWILYGNGSGIKWVPLWFLTHLFAVYCFTYALFKYAKLQELSLLSRWGVITLMMFVGTHWIDYFKKFDVSILGETYELPGLPFSTDLILVTSAFFISGTFMKGFFVHNFKPQPWLICIALMMLGAIASMSDAHMDLNNRVYSHPLLVTLGAACGIYLIIAVSFYANKLEYIRRILLPIGSASLFILIFHNSIDKSVFLALHEYTKNDFIMVVAWLSFLSSIFIPLLIKYLISKSDYLSLFYFPLESNKLIQCLGQTNR